MKTSHHYKVFKSFLPVCFSFALCFFLSTPVYAGDFAGSLNKLTITDQNSTNAAPTAVFTYSKNGDTVNFDASGSSDSDGTISEYRWDFGEGNTAIGSTVSHNFTQPGEYSVTLSVIDNSGAEALSNAQISTASTIMIDVAVNFQPAGSYVPDGFVVDSGASYNQARGYGWTQLPQNRYIKDYDHALSAGQAYDTVMVIAQAEEPAAIWELTVPNGSYLVTVCMGDPKSKRDTQNAKVEGVTIINNMKISSSQVWIEQSSIIEITDGGLTLDLGESSIYARLDWIKIKSQ